MNFLFHMLLSGNDDLLMVGNFMGDFVKGPLLERFDPRIRHGVALHRSIDSFAEQQPDFRRSRQRISPAYGRYRGVMVDLFYDYFLVNSWQNWSDEPFAAYLARTRAVVERHRQALPEKMQPLVPVIFEELLPSYGTVAGIGRACARLSRRIVRQNPLTGGEAELERQHEGLHLDFSSFAPAIIGFAAASRRTIDHRAATNARKESASTDNDQG